LEPWSKVKLVKKFKALTRNKIAYEQIGYLRPRNFQDIKKKEEECTFAPKTNKVSKLLDAQNTIKFVQTQ